MKQLATMVPDEIHARFKEHAQSKNSTVYELISNFVHEQLGIVNYKGLDNEGKINAILAYLSSTDSTYIEVAKKLLPFKATDWDIRQAFGREFLSQPDGSWKRVVKHG